MRRALVVGINEYDFGPLKGAVNDAEAVAALLQRNEDNSINFDCKLLTGKVKKKIDIDRVSLKENIHALLMNEAEVALFYFAGHGIETDFGGYLVTQDSYTFDEGVALNDILIIANESRVREVIIILDCCFSGHFGNAPISGKRLTNIREGVTIITSSRDHQVSREIDGQGVFTKNLLEALEGEAADTLGKVNVAGIYQYVDQVSSPWEQRPIFKTNVSKMVTIRQCYPHIALKVLRKLPLYFQSEDCVISPSSKKFKKRDHEEIDHEVLKVDLMMLGSAGIVSPTNPVDMDLREVIKNKHKCQLTNLGQLYHKMALKGLI